MEAKTRENLDWKLTKPRIKKRDFLKAESKTGSESGQKYCVKHSQMFPIIFFYQLNYNIPEQNNLTTMAVAKADVLIFMFHIKKTSLQRWGNRPKGQRFPNRCPRGLEKLKQKLNQ